MDLLLEPHHDDAALFAAFTCYANKPLVVTVLRSDLQERRGSHVTHDMRAHEATGAMMILGCEWDQLDFSEAAPDWAGVHAVLDSYADEIGFDRIYAPAVELGGHAHHSMVGEIADSVFGLGAVTHYTTYTRTGGRTIGSVPVLPDTGALSAKLAALACYTSQIEEPSTQPWFFGPFQEWYA